VNAPKADCLMYTIVHRMKPNLVAVRLCRFLSAKLIKTIMGANDIETNNLRTFNSSTKHRSAHCMLARQSTLSYQYACMHTLHEIRSALRWLYGYFCTHMFTCIYIHAYSYTDTFEQKAEAILRDNVTIFTAYPTLFASIHFNNKFRATFDLNVSNQRSFDEVICYPLHRILWNE
jgi:hypothetical protein